MYSARKYCDNIYGEEPIRMTNYALQVIGVHVILKASKGRPCLYEISVKYTHVRP